MQKAMFITVFLMAVFVKSVCPQIRYSRGTRFPISDSVAYIGQTAQDSSGWTRTGTTVSLTNSNDAVNIASDSFVLNTSGTDLTLTSSAMTYGEYLFNGSGRLYAQFNHTTAAGFLTGGGGYVLRFGTSANGEDTDHVLKLIAGQTTTDFAELKMISDSTNAGVVISPKGTGGLTIDVDGTPSAGDHDLEIQDGATFSEIDAGEASFAVSSSPALKTDVRKIFLNPPSFRNLNFYRYKYKGNDKETIGLMSDEWNFTMGRPDDGMVAYHELIILMAAKIKQLEKLLERELKRHGTNR